MAKSLLLAVLDMARPLISAVELRNDPPGVAAGKLSRMVWAGIRGEKWNFGAFPFERPGLLKILPGVFAGTLEAGLVVLKPSLDRFWLRSKILLPAITVDAAGWALLAGPVVLQLPMGLEGARPGTSSLTSWRSFDAKEGKEEDVDGWPARELKVGPRCREELSMVS